MLLVFALPACSASSSGDSNGTASTDSGASKTLIVGVSTLGAQYVDPDLANAGGGMYPMKWSIGEGLVYENLKSEYTPGLATDWTVSADKLTWTFHLRKGVKMQDGSDFTADDVKTAIDRIDPKAPEWSSYAVYKNNTASVTVVDPLTVSITTKKPDAFLPQNTPAPIATAYYKSVGEQAFRAKPIAAGPFKAVESKLNDSVTMQRFDDFWDKSRLPSYGQLVLKIIPDEDSRLAALRSGQIDVDASLSSASAVSIKGDATVKLIEVKDSTQAIVKFNDTYTGVDTPLQDVNVRKALLMALDRQSIADSLYRGYATVPNSMALPSITGADKELEVIPYDPEGAKKLLADAGATGFSFTLHTYSQSPSVPNVQQLAEAMVGYWKQIGIDAKLDVSDPAAYLSTVLAHTYDGAYILSSNGGIQPDGSSFLLGYTSTGAYSSVKSPELDDLFAQLSAAVNDQDQHDKIMYKISQNLYDNVWGLPVVNLTTLIATGPKVKEYNAQSGNPYPGPFTGVTLN